MRILLVEDDHLLAQGLQAALQHARYTCNWVTEGKTVLHSLNVPDYDLILLDLGLPDLDGLSVLTSVRKMHPNLPVIVITARDSLEEKVKGLDLGADDYLVKPFDITELLARLRVVERRLGTASGYNIAVGNVSLDTLSHKLSIDNQTVELSKKEYMVLKTLMENAGRIRSRAQIEDQLYEWGEEASSNAVEVHISNVRKKLPALFIQTIRGVGYMVNKA